MQTRKWYFVSRPRFYRYVTVSFILGTVLLFFQNCGKVSFQTADISLPLQEQNIPNATSPSTRPSGSLMINQGHAFTNKSQVQLQVQTQNASSMAVAENECPTKDSNLWFEVVDHMDWNLSDPDGSKSVYLLLKNSQGEVSQCISASIVLDQIPPSLQVNAGPELMTATKNASFKLAASDENSGIDKIYCRLGDESTFSECPTEFSKNDLTEGTHSMNLYVTDKAGNSSSPVAYSWLVDLSAPTVQIVPPLVTGVIYMNSASISFQGADTGGSGLKSFKCTLNNVPYSQCSSPVLLTDLSDGMYSFKVQAIDQVGWESAWAETQFVVDTQPSGAFQILGVTGGADTQIDAYLSELVPPVLHWTASNQAQSYKISIVSADTKQLICEPLVINEANTLMGLLSNCMLQDGVQYIAQASAYRNGKEMKATDFTFKVDAAPPVITIVKSEKSDELKKMHIEFQVTDSGSGISAVTCYRKYKEDLAPSNCAQLTLIDYQNLLPGDYQFYITAVDQLDHQAQSAVIEWRINCPMGQSLVDGVCKNTLFTDCHEFIEMDTSVSPIVIPDLASTGKCYYKKIINAVSIHSSGSAGELRAQDVLARNHDSSSATPSHPFIMGEAQLTFQFMGSRIVSLASSASADGTLASLSIDNFFLVESSTLNQPTKLLARGTADSQPWTDSSKTSVSPILVNNQPVTDFISYAAGGSASVPYIDISRNITVGTDTTLRVRQLDCGGSAQASQVFLIVR